MINKILLLLTLLIVMFSGCASRIEAIPVSTHEEEVFTACKETKSSETCSKEVKVVHYNNDCFGICDFPVTVRTKSTCKYGGGM